MAATVLRPHRCLLSYRAVRYYSAPGDGAIPPAKVKYVPTSGEYPKGFQAGTAHVGVKASNTRFDDLALLASDKPCAAAAVFTQNRFQAAPVTLSRDLLRQRSGKGFRGLVVNSGCANAVTGKGGLEDAVAMSKAADRALGSQATDSDPGSTLVMSTGVIGQRLPLTKITDKIPVAADALGNTHDHWLRAARAICTTDTFPKLISRSFTLPSYPGTTFRMAGMTKGAGMIHPNMATLLGVVCTDAPLSPSVCDTLLRNAADRSFNSISIDGDTSTNDTVALLANGAAVPASAWAGSITSPTSPDAVVAGEALQSLMTGLAQLVVRDGEGATKFVTIRVVGAQSREIGKRVASTVARSPLVKTALYGKDANWGRILCAVGYAEGLPEGAVRPERVSVSFVGASGDELRLLVDGEPAGVDEVKAAELLKEEDLEILIRLDDRSGEEVLFWTCDFSHEYVTINGDYRT